MNLNNLRYFLTEHKIDFFRTYRNFKLLIHPSINQQDELLKRIIDDLELMPKINPTPDKVEIKFYNYDYNANVFNKNELLSFIYASINPNFNIVKGIDLLTKKLHFWLINNNIVFDPSLSIITINNIYFNSKRFKKIEEIKNDNVKDYLKENNNLYKFYNNSLFRKLCKKNFDFSLNFINSILEEFNKNIESQYILDSKKIEDIKEYFMIDNFLYLRQVLSKKRKSFLQSNKIAVHPSIDSNILKEIDKVSKLVSELMKQEYNTNIDYYNNTIRNCYALSIMFNLFDEKFKLIQGGIPYQKHVLGATTNHFYQHSWLETDDIVYDPALRIVTFKELYYTFFQKQDEYTKKETEEILKRIGFNLTYFRNFLDGNPIGNNESLLHRFLVCEVDSHKMKEDGEKLISLIKKRIK